MAAASPSSSTPCARTVNAHTRRAAPAPQLRTQRVPRALPADRAARRAARPAVVRRARRGRRRRRSRRLRTAVEARAASRSRRRRPAGAPVAGVAPRGVGPVAADARGRSWARASRRGLGARGGVRGARRATSPWSRQGLSRARPRGARGGGDALRRDARAAGGLPRGGRLRPGARARRGLDRDRPRVVGEHAGGARRARGTDALLDLDLPALRKQPRASARHVLAVLVVPGPRGEEGAEGGAPRTGACPTTARAARRPGARASTGGSAARSSTRRTPRPRRCSARTGAAGTRTGTRLGALLAWTARVRGLLAQLAERARRMARRAPRALLALAADGRADVREPTPRPASASQACVAADALLAAAREAAETHASPSIPRSRGAAADDASLRGARALDGARLARAQGRAPRLVRVGCARARRWTRRGSIAAARGARAARDRAGAAGGRLRALLLRVVGRRASSRPMPGCGASAAPEQNARIDDVPDARRTA